MNNERRLGYGAEGLSLADVKPFYDRIFPEWEALIVDSDDPSRGEIKYSAASEYYPVVQIDPEELANASKLKRIEHGLGVFTVDNLDEVCARIEAEDEPGGQGKVNFREDWERSSWCFCTDPASNNFIIVQHHN